MAPKTKKQAAPAVTRCVFYRRVSTKEQSLSGLGLEAQQNALEKFAAEKGWRVDGDFCDAGVSGTSDPMSRPGLMQAIELCKKTGAVLLANRVDRLGRDLAHFSALMKAVKIEISELPGAPDLILHLFGSLAQQERKFISERTREALAALQARADAGDAEAAEKIARRNASIYRNRDQKAIDRVNSKRKLDAVQFANHMRGTLAEIQLENGGVMPRPAELVRILNEKGIKSRAGTAWNQSMISRVLARMKPL